MKYRLLNCFSLFLIVFNANSQVIYGPNSGSLAENDAIIGTRPWTGTNNIYTEDNNRATASALVLGDITNYLKVSGFGFSIPTGAEITGISIEVKKRASGLLHNIRDHSVQIVKNGVITGLNRAKTGAWANSDTYYTYGSSSDLWGETWNETDINDPGFGVAISANLSGISLLPTAAINHISITVYYNLSPLPVNLLQFKGTREDKSRVKLEWFTASEAMNDFFTIESSLDAVNWQQQGIIKGAGNSNTLLYYSFFDNNSSSEQVYYRLKQTDFDSKFSFSDMVVVYPTVEPGESILGFPNPVSDYINIRSGVNIKSVQIKEITGKRIEKISFPEAKKGEIKINVNLKNGVYLLQIEDTENRTFLKKIYVK